jgi:alkylated DNA repair dioxygenase AlkB
MDLFSSTQALQNNLLPFDGNAVYYGKIFQKLKADLILQTLLNNIEWKNDEAIIYGKKIITKRKVAWYGDTDFEYKYSGVTKRALIWTETLIELKGIVEDLSQESYNSCLLNLYHNGNEGMAWHSDAEKDLKPNGAIASLSFGAERIFAFKHKQQLQIVPILLEHGSLLVMKGETQKNWLHRLPPRTKVLHPRINLTFRTIVVH